MALRLPTAEDLHKLAAENYFELSAEEIGDFRALMPAMFETIEQLEQMPELKMPIKYRERDPGGRPSPEDDPLNAIVRRCSVKGASSGKLAGKRVGLKDNVCVAGVPMTCASLVLQGYVPDIDATIVTRLLDAGAEIVAMLNMDNFAFSGGGDTSAYGPTLNPHDRQHLAGGSSGGSAAALYYDDIDLTIGGDQGGSIRVPSSWCGVVGLKPTHGLVPYTGIVGIDPTIDYAGPMGRSVADVASLLEVIAGKDPMDPRQAGEVRVEAYTQALGKDIKGLGVGILKEGFGRPESEADVDGAVRKAITSLQGLGARVEEISVPAHMEVGALAWPILAEGMIASFIGNGVGYQYKGLYNTSLAIALGRFRRTRANDFSPQVKLMMMLGTYLMNQYPGHLYTKAQNLRNELTAVYERVLRQIEVLALPTTPMKAHQYNPNYGPNGDRQAFITHGWNMIGNTLPFNLTGHPALNIPCGKSNGLPVGLMLVGRKFQESMLFRTGYAFEQSIDWQKAP